MELLKARDPGEGRGSRAAARLGAANVRGSRCTRQSTRPHRHARLLMRRPERLSGEPSGRGRTHAGSRRNTPGAGCPGAPIVDISDSNLRERLDQVLTQLATTSQILAVLTPTNLYIDMALGLMGIAGPSQEESPSFGKPGVGHWFRGSLDSIPVAANRILQSDRIIVVGASWGKYEEWTDDPVRPLDIEIEEMAGPQGNIKLAARRWAIVTVEDPEAAAAFRIDDLDLRPTLGSSGG